MNNISVEISKRLVKGELPCALAFVIAERLGITPLRVGQEADKMGVRLSKCQLGLFGYGPKAEGKHRRLKPMEEVPPELSTAIKAALGGDGKLSCLAAWQISVELDVSKRTVAEAAEALGVRIGHCQLGAF